VAGARARHISGAAEIERIDAQIGGAQANLARQREEIKSLEADLAETQIMHDRDLSALKRQVDLVKDKTISAEEFEVAETKAKASAQHIESARARIQQAKADLRAGQMTVEQLRAAKAIAEQDRAVSKSALDRAQDQLSKVTITSPLNGVIAQLNVDVGERAVPGIQSNPEATLMTIANMSTIEAEIEADESDIVRVALGQPCEVDVDALPDTPLKAHVTEIGNMPIRTQTTSQEGKDFKVVVMLDDPPKSLRVGMSCEAKITVGVHNNVLAAPIQALTTREVGVDEKGAYAPPPRPAKPGKGIASQSAGAATPKGGKEKGKKTKELQGVFVKDAGNLAHFRPVKTGLMGETQVEIVDGLKEGEEVITGPLNALRTLEEWKLVKKTDIIKEE
jgi:HlyD family secretion protein